MRSWDPPKQEAGDRAEPRRDPARDRQRRHLGPATHPAAPSWRERRAGVHRRNAAESWLA